MPKRPNYEEYKNLYKKYNGNREGFMGDMISHGYSGTYALGKYYELNRLLKNVDILTKPMLLTDGKEEGRVMAGRMYKKNIPTPLIARKQSTNLVAINKYTHTSGLCFRLFHKKYKELTPKELTKYWRIADKTREERIAKGLPVLHRKNRGNRKTVPMNYTPQLQKTPNVSEKRKLLARLLLNGTISESELKELI